VVEELMASQFSFDPTFPPLAPQAIDPSQPSASSRAREMYPYNRHASQQSNQRAILLKPPVAAAPTTDQATSDDSDVQDSIASSLRRLAAPWICEPPDAESYHLAAGIAIPAIDGNFHVVVQITVPSGRNGVLNRIANVFVGGGFTDYSGALIWQIVRNPGSGLTAAERNYENIVASLGSTSNPARIAGIRVFENDVIALVVKNTALPVAGESVGGLLGGWFYPRTWDDQSESDGSTW
jgi:hypothetical protein